MLITFRRNVGLLVVAGCLASLATADVYWNPGDPIARHNDEFAQASLVASSLSPPVTIRRVDCPARLEDEILYVKNRYANPAVNLSIASNRLDIFRVEASWLRALKDNLLDLFPILGPRAKLFDPRALEALTVDGKLLAIPTFLDSTVLYYRSDLLQKYGFDVPKTWDGLEETARAIQQHERASGLSDFWGLQWQGSPNEILTGLTYSFIASQGGGSFINASGQVDIINEHAKKAVERVRGWISNEDVDKQITPARILNQHLHETKVPFMMGRSVFLLDLTHIIGEVQSFKIDGCAVDGNLSGTVSYTHVPGLTWGERATTPWFWGWGVNKYSPEMPDVLRIVDTLATRQQQLFKARNGDPPTLLDLQADPIATCGGLSPPNTCTFPQSDMHFLNRSLFQVGSRYFTLPGADGKDQRGISPLIFNGMSDFLKDPSMTSDQLLRTWACEINFVVNGKTDLCDACPAGFELGASPSQCVMCQLGEATSGTARCSSCQAGKHASLQGSPECSPCPAGHFSAQLGASECVACLPGSMANATGLEMCHPCQAGFYQNRSGSVSCESCDKILLGAVSPRGAISQSECTCPTGSFAKQGLGCIPCLEGLSCEEGGLPQQRAGFWVEASGQGASAEYSVFHCRNQLECPSGPLGSCASQREGLACSRCMERSFKTSLGHCELCSAADVIPFCVAIAAVLVACLVFVRYFSKMALSKQSLTILTVTVTLGQLLSALQALGAIRQLSVKWAEPAKSLMDMLAVLNFDFDVLHMSCVAGADRPVLQFLAQLLAYPFISVSVMLVCFLSRAAGHRIKLDALLNLNGMLLLAFNLTLTLAVLMPLQCIGNPNGTASVGANPGVICWSSDEHWGLVVLALFGIIVYPVSILALATVVTLRYPGLIASGQGLEALQRYAFLFSRFKRETYFYGLLLLCRNSVVALLPVLLVEAPNLQVVSMGAVLLASAAVQARLWPWRTDAANFCDLAMVLMLVVILLAAAPLLKVEEGNKEEVLGTLISVALILMVAVPLGVVALMVSRRLRSSSRFAVFLCHHKAGAGALARFVKMILAKHSPSRVFLDSDQLEDLALIFDAVRQSQNLVVLLSPELLKRMWCAGEISTAHSNGVPITPVICDPGYTPSDEMLAAVPSYWTADQKQTLVSFGISVDMILDAYRYLRVLPSLNLNTMGKLGEKEDLVIELLDRCRLQKRSFACRAKDGEAARILVVGNSSDSETLSTCMIVQTMVQVELQAVVVTARSAEEAKPHLNSADFLLVLFTRGLLEDPSFARLMLAVATQGLEYVTLNADAAFEFPSSDFFKRIESEGLGQPGLGREVGPSLSKVYRALLSILALPLSPHGSEGILKKQVAEVCSRFVDKSGAIRHSTNKQPGVAATTLLPSPDFSDIVGPQPPPSKVIIQIQESV